MSLATSFVEVRPDLRNFGPSLSRGLQRVDASRSGNQVGQTFTKGFGGGIKGLAAMATGALGGLALGAGVSSMLSDSIAEAREAAKVTRLTEAVIRSTGGAAKVTAADVDALAGAISNKTAIDDDAIQAGANLLLTFTNLRNETGKGNDIFNQATQIMTDMSAALGTDAKGSAIQLGKALNDPIKGITALTRVGVSFTQAQKDQIKEMVKAGDTMGAQKVILAELNKEFGGAAAAAADPAQKAQVAWANFKEELGTRMLPTLTRLATWFTDKGIPMLVQFIDVVQDNQGAIKVVIAAVVAWKVAAIAWNAVQAISLFWLKAHTVGTKTHLVVSGLARAATVGWTAAQWLLNAALTANPIGLVIVAIAALAAGIIYAYKHSETFRKIVDNTWKVVAAGARWMWEKVLRPTFTFLIKAWVEVAGAIIRGAASAFGWVPGLGPKLRAAAAKFEEFKRGVNKSLGGISDQSVTVRATYSSNFTALMRAAGKSVSADVFARRHGAAYGGPIKGPGTGRSDSAGLWALSNGEHVWTADEVSAAGGHAAVEGLRRAVVGKRAVGGAVFNINAVADPYRAMVERDAANAINRSGAGNIAGRARESLEQAVAAAVRAGAVAGGGNTLARVRAALLPGLYVTSTYRSPAQNAAVGGSPSSYHMDRNNPAVDIGGPTYLLDAMASKLRRMGGWRELLWRVAGHYDHVHVADTGGLLKPGDLGLNMGQRPERVLSGQQTQAFERLVAVLEGGGASGPRTLVIVDKDGDLIGRMRVEAGDVLDDELRAARWGDE